MKWSILDYGVLDFAQTPTEALQTTVEMAQHAESLGFHRFWVAEHHNVHALTISNPELMMMHLLNQTTTIRIGSGGIMALHYSAYKLAEISQTFTALFPNRVDLGFGNSLGTPQVNQALKSVYQAEEYAQALQDFYAYLQDNHTMTANPTNPHIPPVWLLSMGEKSAALAGQLGCGYTYGIFPYIPQNALEQLKRVSQVYRTHFTPTLHQTTPHVMLAVFIVIAESEVEAEQLAKAVDIWMLGNEAFNEFATFPTIEQGEYYPLSPQQQATIVDNRRRIFVGTPEQIHRQLQPYIAACQADELLCIPLVPSKSARLKSLDLLATLINDK